MPRPLDTTLFDRVAAATRNDTDAQQLVQFLQAGVTSWQASGCARSTPSFGLVALSPKFAGQYSSVWSSPSQLMEGGMVLGWGPEWRRYVANALRKCRAVAREGLDSLYIANHEPSRFRDPVEEFDDNGEFLDGDFPWGGAVTMGSGPEEYIVGVSSLTQEEDDLVARLAVQFLMMIRREGPYSVPDTQKEAEPSLA
jgi:hypothetical protein